MSDNAPAWETEGRDWPHRDASRFVEAGGIRWHVQVAGAGPAIVLLHGTAASTHSWAGLLPLLARHGTVVAPDLPGHGFTAAPGRDRYSLPAMAELVAALLDAMGIVPAVAAGHSAGATILADLFLDRRLASERLVVLNHSLASPFGHMPGLLTAVGAAIVQSPLVPAAVARMASRSAVEARLRATGSTLDPRAVGLYARLLRYPRHVGAALAMMAQWDLAPVALGLARLDLPVLLVAGERDPWFPPRTLEATAARLPHATVEVIAGTGHLSHEERPEEVAGRVLRFGMAPSLRSG